MNLPTRSSEGYQIANNGLRRLILTAGLHCKRERDQVEAAHRPEVVILEARQETLIDEHKRHRRELDQLPLYGPQRVNGGSAVISLLVAFLLIVAGAILNWYGIEPFNMGPKGVIYAASLAILLPFGAHQLPRYFPWGKVALVAVIATVAAGLSTDLGIALIRGDLWARNVDTEPDAIIEGAEKAATHTDDRQMVLLMRWAMGLGTVGIEAGAALALLRFQESRRVAKADKRKQIQSGLVATEDELLAVTTRLHALLAEPAEVEANFWADVHQGMSDAMSEHSSSKFLLTVALLIALVAPSADASDALRAVVLLDVTKTAQAKGSAGTTEFAQNVQAVERLLSQMPLASHVSVLGITGTSLASPYTILEARLPSDPGLLSGNLVKGRTRLVSEWRKRAEQLQPTWPHTDVLGSLMYAAELLMSSDASRKTLSILSDLRDDTPGFDLETPAAIDVQKSLKWVERRKLVASFAGVEIYASGVGGHGVGKDILYTRSLSEFWLAYFKESNALVRLFSTTREMERLTEAVAPRKVSKER